MKAVREYERRYYKWTEWTQPLLTSNNTSTSLGNIVTTASTYYNDNTQPYMIMTGTTSTTVDNGYWQLNNKTTEEWLNINFPYKLKISALSVVTRPRDNYNRTFSVYAGIGGEQIGSDITPTAEATRYTIVSGGEYITDNIFIKVHAQSTQEYFGLQNLQITAQYAKDAESSDYDYYIDVPVLKLPKKSKRYYYKYTLEPFSMPSFSSNKGWGTVYNSDKSDVAYYIFDNPSSGGNRYSRYTSGGRIPIDWYWDCPDYLQLTSVFYWGQTYSNTSYATNSLTIYGWDYEANDWKQLGYQANTWESDYTNYDVACEELLTNKFKFTVVFKNIDDYFPSTLTELVPKGYKRVAMTADESDYDFYEDGITFMAINN